MNGSQVTGSIDRVLLVLITWGLTQAANKGLLSTSDIATLAPALAVIIAFIVGYIQNTASKIALKASVIAENPNSPIQAVITTNTPEGRELAKSIPSPTIVTAGTVEATSIAKGNI